MDCKRSQAGLLQAEPPAALPTAPSEVDDHARACPECGRLLQKLVRLEEQWRALPPPPAVEAAKRRLLKKAAAAAPRPLPRRTHVRRAGRWVTAAAILIAAGICVWFAVKPHPPPSKYVIDQL